MRDSVPSPRYSPVCNVLRQWKTSLILTYRVYRLYDSNIYLIFLYICNYINAALCGKKGVICGNNFVGVSI